MCYRSIISLPIKLAVLILPTLLVFNSNAQAQACAELELSTRPFTKGVALAPADLLPTQRLVERPMNVYFRRTMGAGCQPPPAYVGPNKPITLRFTFKYDLPTSGQRTFSISNNNSAFGDVKFLNLSDGADGEITLNASDGISDGFFVISYTDAGLIGLSVVDTANAAAIANHQMSWFPAAFAIERIFVAGKPDIFPPTGEQATLLRAGEAFSVIASARARFNNRLTPNFGPDVPGGPAGDGEQLILRSNLQAPTFADGGRNGPVANNPETGGILVNGTQWRPQLDANGRRTGRLIGEGFKFNEVGVIQLSVGLAPQQNEAMQDSPAVNSAFPDNSQYFGGTSIPVAVNATEIRAIPASFGASNSVEPTDVQANLPQFKTGCALPGPAADANNILQGGFTYAGDSLTYVDGIEPKVTVTPQTADGLPVKNYLIDPFMKLTQKSLIGRAYNSAVGNLEGFGRTNDAGTPDVTDDFAEDLIITRNQEDGTISIKAILTAKEGAIADQRLLSFARDPAVPVAPFNADISLTVPIVDEDGVTTSDNLPVIFGAPTPGNGIAFSADGLAAAPPYTGRQIRHGQLKVGNGAGRTTDDQMNPSVFVKLPLTAEYYTDNGFQPNDWDSCTKIVKAAITLEEPNGQDGNANFLPENRFAELNPVPNPPRANLPVASLINGDAMLLYFSSEAGTARIFLDFDAVPAPAPLYLKPDDANLRGRLSFGLYQGDPRIVHRTYHSRGVN